MFLIGVMPFLDDECLRCIDLKSCTKSEMGCPKGRQSNPKKKCIVCNHEFELGEKVYVVGEHEFRPGLIPGFGSHGEFCKKCFDKFFKTDKQEKEKKLS